MALNDDEKQRDTLRRYGWLRRDDDGVERMHTTREVTIEAAARYHAYADEVKKTLVEDTGETS